MIKYLNAIVTCRAMAGSWWSKYFACTTKISFLSLINALYEILLIFLRLAAQEGSSGYNAWIGALREV